MEEQSQVDNTVSYKKTIGLLTGGAVGGSVVVLTISQLSGDGTETGDIEENTDIEN